MTELRSSLGKALRRLILSLLEASEDCNWSWNGKRSYKWTASKTDIKIWIEKTIVVIMKKISVNYDEEIVSLPEIQFYVKAKFLHDHLSGRTRAHWRHSVQRVDAVPVALNADKFPSKNGAFYSLHCEGKVVCKYFVVTAIVGNMTSDTFWVIGTELVCE